MHGMLQAPPQVVLLASKAMLSDSVVMLAAAMPQEASTLVSALAVALGSTRVPWPALVPVKDHRRDGFTGIAAAGTGTMHYDVDGAHLSQLPEKMLQVGPHMDAFA